MTNHLNEIEIIDYLKGHSDLPIDRRAHLTECDYCKQSIKDQSEVNGILSKMKLLKAPSGIYTAVSRRVLDNPVHSKDWFFYITLVVIAVIAMMLFFDFGNEKVQKISGREEQVKDFIQKKMFIDKLKIEENTIHVYHNFISVMKEFSRSTYGSTILFVLLVILFYLFVDQQFLRKKLNH